MKPKATTTVRKRHITAAEFVNSTILPMLILLNCGVWASLVLLVWQVSQQLPRTTEVIHHYEPLIPAATVQPIEETKAEAAPKRQGHAEVNGRRAW